MSLYRARFETNADDYRPVVWPIAHPYWCTGVVDYPQGSRAILVAYVDSKEQLMQQWPDAEKVDMGEPVEKISFTDRFPVPDWYMKKCLAPKK